MNQLQKLPGWSGKLPEADCDNIIVLLKCGKTISHDCEYGWIHSNGEVIHIDAGNYEGLGPDQFPLVTKVAEIPLDEILLITYHDLITDKINTLIRTTPPA